MNTEINAKEILTGKRIYFIGDSLFGGHGIGIERSWPNLLAEKYSMPFFNYGINGSTVSACEGCSNPIVKRYADMAEDKPDIVVLEGGRNDFNKHAVIEGDDGDITTYRGALIATVEGLRKKYPGALIIGVTFWRSGTRINDRGHLCSEYTDAMKRTFRELSVEFIDTTDTDACPVHMLDREFREKYCFVPGDVCHLNVAGMELALEYFEVEIAKIAARVWGK